MAVFAEGWTVALVTSGGIDSRLDDTRERLRRCELAVEERGRWSFTARR